MEVLMIMMIMIMIIMMMMIMTTMMMMTTTQHLLTFSYDLFLLIVPWLYHLLSSVNPFVPP